MHFMLSETPEDHLDDQSAGISLYPYPCPRHVEIPPVPGHWLTAPPYAPLQVSLWCSDKKFQEFAERGIFDGEKMKEGNIVYPERFLQAISEHFDPCQPVLYNRFHTRKRMAMPGDAPVAPPEGDPNLPIAVEERGKNYTAHLTSNVILHKNAEIMAGALMLQDPLSLRELEHFYAMVALATSKERENNCKFLRQHCGVELEPDPLALLASDYQASLALGGSTRASLRDRMLQRRPSLQPPSPSAGAKRHPRRPSLPRSLSRDTSLPRTLSRGHLSRTSSHARLSVRDNEDIEEELEEDADPDNAAAAGGVEASHALPPPVPYNPYPYPYPHRTPTPTRALFAATASSPARTPTLAPAAHTSGARAGALRGSALPLPPSPLLPAAASSLRIPSPRFSSLSAAQRVRSSSHLSLASLAGDVDEEDEDDAEGERHGTSIRSTTGARRDSLEPADLDADTLPADADGDAPLDTDPLPLPPPSSATLSTASTSLSHFSATSSRHRLPPPPPGLMYTSRADLTALVSPVAPQPLACGPAVLVDAVDAVERTLCRESLHNVLQCVAFEEPRPGVLGGSTINGVADPRAEDVAADDELTPVLHPTCIPDTCLLYVAAGITPPQPEFPEEALSRAPLPELLHPLFAFTPHSLAMQATFLADGQPVPVIVKNIIACGVIASHSAVLTTTVLPASPLDSDTRAAPAQPLFRPNPALWALPPGVYLVQRFVPHRALLKAYVMHPHCQVSVSRTVPHVRVCGADGLAVSFEPDAGAAVASGASAPALAWYFNSQYMRARPYTGDTRLVDLLAAEAMWRQARPDTADTGAGAAAEDPLLDAAPPSATAAAASPTESATVTPADLAALPALPSSLALASPTEAAADPATSFSTPVLSAAPSPPSPASPASLAATSAVLPHLDLAALEQGVVDLTVRPASLLAAVTARDWAALLHLDTEPTALAPSVARHLLQSPALAAQRYGAFATHAQTRTRAGSSASSASSASTRTHAPQSITLRLPLSALSHLPSLFALFSPAHLALLYLTAIAAALAQPMVGLLPNPRRTNSPATAALVREYAQCCLQRARAAGLAEDTSTTPLQCSCSQLCGDEEWTSQPVADQDHTHHADTRAPAQEPAVPTLATLHACYRAQRVLRYRHGAQTVCVPLHPSLDALHAPAQALLDPEAALFPDHMPAPAPRSFPSGAAPALFDAGASSASSALAHADAASMSSFSSAANADADVVEPFSAHDPARASPLTAAPLQPASPTSASASSSSAATPPTEPLAHLAHAHAHSVSPSLSTDSSAADASSAGACLSSLFAVSSVSQRTGPHTAPPGFPALTPVAEGTRCGPPVALPQQSSLDTALAAGFAAHAQALPSLAVAPLPASSSAPAALAPQPCAPPCAPLARLAHSLFSAPAHTLPTALGTRVPHYLPRPLTRLHCAFERSFAESPEYLAHVRARKAEKKRRAASKSLLGKRTGTVDAADEAAEDGARDAAIITPRIAHSAQVLAKLLHQRLDLALFGFDLVQCPRTRKLHVVDVNYFPSYRGFDAMAANLGGLLLRNYTQHWAARALYHVCEQTCQRMVKFVDTGALQASTGPAGPLYADAPMHPAAPVDPACVRAEMHLLAKHQAAEAEAAREKSDTPEIREIPTSPQSFTATPLPPSDQSLPKLFDVIAPTPTPAVATSPCAHTHPHTDTHAHAHADVLPPTRAGPKSAAGALSDEKTEEEKTGALAISSAHAAVAPVGAAMPETVPASQSGSAPDTDADAADDPFLLQGTVHTHRHSVVVIVHKNCYNTRPIDGLGSVTPITSLAHNKLVRSSRAKVNYVSGGTRHPAGAGADASSSSAPTPLVPAINPYSYYTRPHPPLIAGAADSDAAAAQANAEAALQARLRALQPLLSPSQQRQVQRAVGPLTFLPESLRSKATQIIASLPPYIHICGYGSLMSYGSTRITCPNLQRFQPVVTLGYSRSFSLISLSIVKARNIEAQERRQRLQQLRAGAFSVLPEGPLRVESNSNSTLLQAYPYLDARTRGVCGDALRDWTQTPQKTDPYDPTYNLIATVPPPPGQSAPATVCVRGETWWSNDWDARNVASVTVDPITAADVQGFDTYCYTEHGRSDCSRVWRGRKGECEAFTLELGGSQELQPVADGPFARPAKAAHTQPAQPMQPTPPDASEAPAQPRAEDADERESRSSACVSLRVRLSWVPHSGYPHQLAPDGTFLSAPSACAGLRVEVVPDAEGFRDAMRVGPLPLYAMQELLQRALDNHLRAHHPALAPPRVDRSQQRLRERDAHPAPAPDAAAFRALVSSLSGLSSEGTYYNRTDITAHSPSSAMAAPAPSPALAASIPSLSRASSRPGTPRLRPTYNYMNPAASVATHSAAMHGHPLQLPHLQDPDADTRDGGAICVEPLGLPADSADRPTSTRITITDCSAHMLPVSPAPRAADAAPVGVGVAVRASWGEPSCRITPHVCNAPIGALTSTGALCAPAQAAEAGVCPHCGAGRELETEAVTVREVREHFRPLHDNTPETDQATGSGAQNLAYGYGYGYGFGRSVDSFIPFGSQLLESTRAVLYSDRWELEGGDGHDAFYSPTEDGHALTCVLRVGARLNLQTRFFLCHPAPVLSTAFRIPREDFVGYITREQRYDFDIVRCASVNGKVLKRVMPSGPILDAPCGASAAPTPFTPVLRDKTDPEPELRPDSLLMQLPPTLPPEAVTGAIITAVVCKSTTDDLYRRKIAHEIHYYTDISSYYTGKLWGQRGLRPGKRYLQFCLRAAYELCGVWGYLSFAHSTRLDDGTLLADYIARRWDVYGLEAVKNVYFKSL